MASVRERIKQAWNAFNSSAENQSQQTFNIGPSSSVSMDRPRTRFYNERTIVTAIYNRIAIDVADILIRHIKLDADGRYIDDINSDFNRCLTLEPNLDQGPTAFRQDVVTTLFDSGVSAIVPVDTRTAPGNDMSFDILTMRVGSVKAWYPRHVRVDLYNEATGVREEITLEKTMVALVVNPLYSVINAPNSTLQRLTRKLSLLDAIDEQSGSGKLDLIIQLPYVIKSDARRQQAEKRREDIEFQLKDSRYGIAYTDGTEKITQLNRPTENNLMAQITYLTTMLYGQLGITEEVMNGTADEKTMLNYFNRTIKPILVAIVEAMQRAFLGVIGTNNKEKVMYFRDPFALIPVADLAEIVDKFTRNEVMTSNEIRAGMGFKPSKDPKADQLVNSNMPQANAAPPGPSLEEMDAIMDETFNGLSADIDKIAGGGANA